MTLFKLMYFFIIVLFLTAVHSTAGEPNKQSSGNKDRNQIPEQYKWDLSCIYKSMEDCDRHKQTFAPKFEKAAAFKGTLGKSAQNFDPVME